MGFISGVDDGVDTVMLGESVADIDAGAVLAADVGFVGLEGQG